MRLAIAMPINLKDTNVAITTLICRIGVKFKRYKPMTQAHLTRGITTTSLLFLLGLSIQLAILHRFYPQPVLMYVMDESYPFFAPVLVPSVPLLSGGEGVGELTGIAVAGPPPLQPPPPPRATATTIVGAHVYTQRWEFCRFDKVVSRTQSLAYPRKFGAPIRKLQLARSRRILTSGLSRKNLASFLFSLFLLLEVRDLLFFLSFFFSLPFQKCVKA